MSVTDPDAELNPGVNSECENPRCVDGWVHLVDDPATVYPCKRCRTDLFFRWAEGHYNAAHLDEPCSTCAEIRGTTHTASKRRKRRKRGDGDPGPTPPPEPDDSRRYGDDG